MSIEKYVAAPLLALATVCANAQQKSDAAFDAETLQHFQALVRMDTQSPPGNEKPAADYLAQVLKR